MINLLVITIYHTCVYARSVVFYFMVTFLFIIYGEFWIFFNYQGVEWQDLYPLWDHLER